MSLLSIFRKKEGVVFNECTLYDIANQLDLSYYKVIDPKTLVTCHTFTTEISGKDYVVSRINGDMLVMIVEMFDDNAYREVMNIVKCDKEFSIKEIMKNAKADCTMKY